MRNRSLLALSVLFVLGLLASTASQAAPANSCSAGSLFGGCSVTCPLDQRPVCSSYALWSSCTCVKWETSDPQRAFIGMNEAQRKNLEGYIALTSAFDSTAGKQVNLTAKSAYEALLAKNPVVYHANVLAHEEAAKYLSLEEQEQVDAYVASIR